MAGANAQEVYVKNHRGINSDVLILTKNTPIYSLPAHDVPDNVAVVVKNNPGNPPGLQILIDGKKISETSYPLLPGDSIPYWVENTSRIYAGVVGPFPAGVDQVIVNFTHEID